MIQHPEPRQYNKRIHFRANVIWNEVRVGYDVNMLTNLDLVLSIEFVVVKSIFGNSGAAFVHVFHERDVLFCWNKPHFVEVWISKEVRKGFAVDECTY